MGKITINQDSLKTSRDWVRHKVNVGTNIFRILPPFGDAEVHNNYPYRKWSTVWLQDPRSGNRRPFATPMTDGDNNCPVKEYLDLLKKSAEDKKARLTAEGYSEADVKAEMEGINSILWNIRVQHTYAYNAADQSGTVGILELKSTAHQGLKKKMNQYIKDYAQDPTSLGADEEDSGVWFAISKDGKGKDTEYAVDFNQTRQKINGQLMKMDDRSPLPENVTNNYNDLAYDLNTIYMRKNYDELKAILLYNIALIAQEVPDAVVPGFEVDGVEVKAAPAKTTTRAPVQEAAPAAKKAPVKTVTLNLSDDDTTDDDSDVAPARVSAPVKTAPVSNKVQATVRTASAPSVNDAEMDALTKEILGE